MNLTWRSSSILPRTSRFYQKSFRVVSTESRKESAQQEQEVTHDQQRDPVLSEEKKARAPFLKNLFLGRFDKDVLGFPELNKARQKNFNAAIAPALKSLMDAVDPRRTDAEGTVPDSVLKELKNQRILGGTVSEDYGGLGLNAMEQCLVAEFTGSDASVAGIVNASNNMVIQVLFPNSISAVNKYGSAEIKQKYLPRLASGQLTAAWCLTEETGGSDTTMLNARAAKTLDGKFFDVTGKKIWVINAEKADLFLVFVRIQDKDELHNPCDITSAILVEKSEAVALSPCPSAGLRGAGIQNITFNKAHVPVEHLLGDTLDGNEIAFETLANFRCASAAQVAATMRGLLTKTIRHCIDRMAFGQTVADFDMVREHLGKLAVWTYAVESMAYLTAGMTDSGEYPDTQMECAATKVFSSEKMWSCLSECLVLLGSKSCSPKEGYEQYLRDSYCHHHHGGANDILRLYIGLKGLEYAGKEMQALVKVMRHPYDNPSIYMKKNFRGLWESIRFNKDNIKLKMHLYGHIHPTLKHISLQPEAEILERLVLRFPVVIEHVLIEHGAYIPQRQMLLRRMADCIIYLHALTAVLARASRSYCIGLRHANVE
ncbi:unnamed protein product, partial [Darwinula stevensoni]